MAERYDFDLMKQLAKDNGEKWVRYSDYAALAAENERLRDRLAEALKALEPFAALADIFDHHAGNRPKEGLIAQWSDHRVGDRDIKVEHLRAARRALEGGE